MVKELDPLKDTKSQLIDMNKSNNSDNVLNKVAAVGSDVLSSGSNFNTDGREEVNKGILKQSDDNMEKLRANQDQLKLDEDILKNKEDYKIEMDKARKVGQIKIDKEISTFIKNKSTLDTEANKYKNYNDINSKYNNIINDIKNIYNENLKNGVENYTQLSDDQATQIAAKYGVTAADVINPNSLFKGLELTDDEQNKAATNLNRSIENLDRDKKRTKEDLWNKYNEYSKSINQNINDVERAMDLSIRSGTKIGALTGQIRSGGYVEGLDNIRKNAERTVTRLKDLLETASDNFDTNNARLMEDYTTSSNRITEDFKTNIDKINYERGIQLNNLQTQYGLSNEDLTEKLDALKEEIDLSKFNVYTKYKQTYDDLLSEQKDKIDYIDKQVKIVTEAQDKLMTTYTDNDGIILNGTSLETLTNQYKSGLISNSQYGNLVGLMVNNIKTELGNYGLVTPEDVQTIHEYLLGGLTPDEIITKLRQDERFKEMDLTPKEKLEEKKTNQALLESQAKINMINKQIEQMGVLSDEDKAKIDEIKANTDLINKKTEQLGVTTPEDKLKLETMQATINKINAETAQVKAETSDKYLGGGKVEIPEMEVKTGLVSFLNDDKNAIGKKGGQCGAFANNYLKSVGVEGNVFGNLIGEKKAVMNSKVPTVGAAAVMNSSKKPKNGHVAIVTSVSDDGKTFTATDSNYYGDEIIGDHTYNTSSMLGFYVPAVEKPDITKTREYNQAIKMLIGIGGTKDERAGIAKDLTEYAIDNDISILEAKAEIYPDQLKYKEKIDLETKIGKDNDNNLAGYRDIMTRIGIMDQSFEKGKKDYAEGKSINAISQGILVTFQKILDEDSVVRESEYGRSSSGTSLLDRLDGLKTQILQGGAKVNIGTLQEFVDTAHTFQKEYEKAMFDFLSRDKKKVKNYGLNEENVFTPSILKKFDEIKKTEGTIDSKAKDENIMNNIFGEIKSTETGLNTNESKW